jgi:hypothetical protein
VDISPAPHSAATQPVTVRGPVNVISRSAILWVTREGDPVDYFVRPGEQLAFRESGLIVIEALLAGQWQVERRTPRRPACFRWRGVGVRLQP